MHLLLLQHHDVKDTYKNAFVAYHYIILINIYAFAIPYAIFMHLGLEEETTLLEINEGEEGDQQEIPQAAAPEEEQIPEELPECPDHRPTSFLRGKPQSILSLPVFYKYYSSSYD